MFYVPIFVLFSFKIIHFAKLQFVTSSILVMHMQFFILISIIYNFHNILNRFMNLFEIFDFRFYTFFSYLTCQ